MESARKRRLRMVVHHGLFVVLLVLLAALLAYFARQYRVEHDLTRGHRNTLSAATLDVLKQLEGPVLITAYAVTRDANGENVHRRIEEIVRPYQRAKPDIALRLVDPRENPRAAAQAGVRGPLELMVEYKRRTERLADLGEQSFANALMRLARGTERLVLWLDGHGERKLNGIANHEMGEFGRHLQEKGFRINSVNLSVAQEVPDNAAMLVIASPQVALLPAEVQKIQRYLAKGGNLFWLIDPGPLYGLEPVAEMLGMVLTPGVVVDPDAGRFNAPLATAVGTSYGRHAITNVMSKNTFFPFARQIGSVDADEWRETPLVQVAQRGWVETGKLDGKITFDKERDTPGPVTIAVTFERSVGDRQQRVVTVGTGEFLANAFLGNLGNLDLGVNIVNWLSGDDNLITLQPRASADSSINIDQTLLYSIAFSFLLVLPFAFLVTGIAIWWRRRRI